MLRGLYFFFALQRRNTKSNHEKPITLDDGLINYNVPVAKMVDLVWWISHRIYESRGNFITSNDLYSQYQEDISKNAQLKEVFFFNEIEAMLSAFGLFKYLK